MNLYQSEEKYSTIFNAVNDAIIVLDAEKHIVIDINKQAYELFGFTRDEFVNDPFNFISDVEGGYGKELVIKYINEAQSGKPVVFEWKAKNKRGKIFWIEVQFKMVQIGLSALLMAIVKNIDEQKKTEWSLKINEERLRMALDASNDGLWDINLETTTAYYSTRFFTMLGYSRDSFKSDLFLIRELLHPDDLNRILHIIREFIESTEEFIEYEMRLRKQDGSYAWILSRGKVFKKDSKGKPLRIVGTHVEISQRKKQENIQRTLFGIANAVNTTPNLEELFVSIQNTLGTVMDTKNCYVTLYDEKTETLSLPFYKDEKDSFTVFPAGKTLTAYVIKTGKTQLVDKKKAEELEKLDIIETIGTPSESWLGVPLKHGNKIIGVFTVQSYDVNTIYTEDDVQILEFVSDHIALAIERKSYEENLKLAKTKAEESDRLKSAFLSNMSHEIRTPMNAIVGFAGLLSSFELTEEDKRDFIEQINNGAETLMLLIDDIIDISKIEAGQLIIQNSEFVLSEILNELKMIFCKALVHQNKSKLHLIEDNHDYPVDIMLNTDKHRLKQVFSNLLSNAIKFTESGEIRFGIKKLDGQHITFYVKDTGIGIEPEKLDCIFERFRQAHESSSKLYSGTGLGLAISKNLTELMKGKISVRSTPGCGTEFEFIIPLYSDLELLRNYKDGLNKTEINPNQMN